MRVALTVASSDPTGGAGLQADLRVFQALGVYGMGVVVALTIQDSDKVHSILPVFPSVALDQLRTLLADVTPHAVKIGALGSDDIVRNVSLGLALLSPEVPIVLDPILFSSSGAPLLERRAWGSLQELIGRCHLVTPNLPEAEALSGRDVSRRAGVEDAARYFLEDLGAKAVLIKGGHGSGPPDDLMATRAPDLSFSWLPGERLNVGRVHGTGCALSSAIAAALAKGRSLPDAIEGGRAFVKSALMNASGIGRSARFLVFS